MGLAFAAPFVLGLDGNRDSVCDRYHKYLWDRIHTGEITVDDLLGLQGKDLACFCATRRCHGESILESVEWAVNINNS